MTFFSNVLRLGAIINNAKLSLSGTVVTLRTHEGSNPTASNPIEIRYPEGDEVVLDSPTSGLSINFGAATFGLPLTVHEPIDLHVGLVKTSSGVSLVIGVFPTEQGTYDTPVNCTTDTHLATPTTVTPTSSILWIGRIVGLTRNNGNWVTTNAKVIRWTH